MIRPMTPHKNMLDRSLRLLFMALVMAAATAMEVVAMQRPDSMATLRNEWEHRPPRNTALARHTIVRTTQFYG